MKSYPIFLTLCAAMGVPPPVSEHKFHPARKWRFDFAWPEVRLALEVEGGVWTGGRHTRGAGFLKDIEKYNVAACLGWRVLRCTPGTLLHRETIEAVKQARCVL